MTQTYELFFEKNYAGLRDFFSLLFKVVVGVIANHNLFFLPIAHFLSYGKSRPKSGPHLCAIKLIHSLLKKKKMVQSTEFMLLFRFEPNLTYQPTEAENDAQHAAWGAFIGQIAIQEKLVSTHQLDFGGVQIAADRTVAMGVHYSKKEMLGGNMMVRAASIEEAIELAKNCPILDIGGTVEVRQTVPM